MKGARTKIVVLMLILCLTSYGYVRAQKSDLIRLKTEDNFSKEASKYLYEGFQESTVYYRNGGSLRARLNYNLLTKEMQFVNLSGDTLSLANEYTFLRITVSRDTFYYDLKKGYLKMVATQPGMKLVVQQFLKVAGVDKIGAYGQSSGVSSIKNYQSYSTGNGPIYKLDVKGDIVFSKEATYFLMDPNYRTLPAIRKGFLSAYPKHRKSIENYLKQEPVRFNKEEDLKRLLRFCESLKEKPS
ncbi:hypothetical protein GCM10027275_06520 [Rhabdobacter roseus]|uniref:Uncharacterized protein n=1 Tax=Rhabdobacter roseus TaxID=1655419 RepID=A0A840TS65_9BACT|nr:hypothetical protein [Rhabdobacter roseus]MBB5282549.1 hypothetical protein [Rhabdobacter roseus]